MANAEEIVDVEVIDLFEQYHEGYISKEDLWSQLATFAAEKWQVAKEESKAKRDLVDPIMEFTTDEHP